MTRCVVFDFDGVLVDSNAVKRQAYFDIFAPLGPEAAPVIARVLAGHGDGDRFEIIGAVLRLLQRSGVTGGAGPTDIVGFATRYNDICEEHAATCQEVRGASAALGRLAESRLLYLSSATPEEPLRRIIQRRGWTRYFRDVFGRPGSKGDHLRTVMAREALSGPDMLVVGDGRRDLAAAREVGARFIGVRNRFNDFDGSSLLLIDDLRALPELIDSEGTPASLSSGS